MGTSRPSYLRRKKAIKDHGGVYLGGGFEKTTNLTGGGSFFCPHCGALYSVTRSRLPAKESNIAKCVVCGKIVDSRIQETFLPQAHSSP